MASATETVLSSSLTSNLLIVQVVMLTLAVVSYLLRVLIKFRRCDGFGIDDLFALLALVFFVVIQATIWHSISSGSAVLASEYTNTNSQVISRYGIHTVLFWSVIAFSQLSIFWFYRFVCSGFSWAKTLLTTGFTLTISGWAAFTICDGLNFAYATSNQMSLTKTGMITGYKSFESASMILEVSCSFMILCNQLFRLHHILGKVYSKPYLVLIPIVTAIVMLTGVLRLVYFLQQNTVSEVIWSQLHFGLSILCNSVPVYAGLETLCCKDGDGHSDRIEIWLQSVSPQVSNTSVPEDIKCPSDNHNRNEDVKSTISFPVSLSRDPSDASQSLPIPAELLEISSRHGLRHGHTRHIMIEPARFPTQQEGTEFIPARRPSDIENGTKRFMLEE